MTRVFEILPGRIERLAAAAAGWLAARGVGGGDRIVVPAQNDPRLLALTQGALRTGIVPVLINPAMDERERSWIESDAEPALIVRDLDQIDWDFGTAELAPRPLGRPMLYTSGTTGRPKGVWGGLLDEADARAWALDEQALWAAAPDAPVLVCSPLYHSAGHRLATAALIAGARILLLERFDADAVVRILSKQAVSSVFLVPTHLRRILQAGDPPAPRDARKVLHAGESCPAELKRRALDWIENLWEFYGSTEGQFTAISPDEWRLRPGSVGRARAARTLSIAEAGEDGIGTVFVTAPPFARWEYWRDPQRTAAAWRGGAFTAGDLGRLDDGYLTLAARREDLIITGGVNVYPGMIEAALLEHPGVRDVAVFGVADDQWGQRVCAAIVADEPLEAWIHERLHGPYLPKTVLRMDALPRTPVGKIDRAALRDAIASG